MAPPPVRREGDKEEVREREPKVASWEEERECWRVMGEKDDRWSGEGGDMEGGRGEEERMRGGKVCDERQGGQRSYFCSTSLLLTGEHSFRRGSLSARSQS